MTYVEAIGRNPGEERQHSHLYAEVEMPTDVASSMGMGATTGYVPMCRYGWNRSDGEEFSILRGHRGARGLCRTCERRRDCGLPPVESKPGSHKTKWL
jgi:hypothetical protein